MKKKTFSTKSVAKRFDGHVFGPVVGPVLYETPSEKTVLTLLKRLSKKGKTLRLDASDSRNVTWIAKLTELSHLGKVSHRNGQWSL